MIYAVFVAPPSF